MSELPPARDRAPGTTLSEHESKRLLAGYGVVAARESLVDSAEEAVRAAALLGHPVVVKLCGARIAHKTERGLVRLALADAAAVRRAAEELLALRRPEDGDARLLVGEMVRGSRELIAGVVQDAQLGPCVMLGLGGILAEALGDVVFAAAPVSDAEARRMLRGLRTSRLLLEPFRGEPAVDEDALVALLVGLGRLAAERPDIASVDVNPLIVRGATPIAVDALVELASAPAPTATKSGKPAQPARSEPKASEAHANLPKASEAHANLPKASEAHANLPQASKVHSSRILARFAPLFHPRGVIVAGASSHPGKFGFVVLHNLLRFGYAGEVFPVNREGAEVLGRKCFRDVAEVPEGAADLVFVCTPNSANVELLRACARKGVRAAFIASAGYGEAGPEGRKLEQELVAVADELGMLIAGPNGQGVISTPRSMCAQIVAPYPPPGAISVASQSGNLVSSFLNYAVETGIGVSKAISCGNSAQTGLADYLEYFAADPETSVALGYLEGIGDGRRFLDAVRGFTARKPLVLVKGGVAAEGKRAAASHTGSLASDDRVFDGVCRQLGISRAATVEQAFEWAASFATQPLPKGRRVVVFTTAGGWGVLAADACAAAGLELVALPDDVRAAIDARVPARWSRNNPIDLAGGETRDTVPELLDIVCAHPDVDAVIHLGIGIQAAQANAFRGGEFHPGYGLDRIVAYHERQDRRYAEAAREASERHGKPVLTATELAVTDRAYGNAGPQGVKAQGRLCYASAHRAVSALRALVDYAEYRRSLGAQPRGR